MTLRWVEAFSERTEWSVIALALTSPVFGSLWLATGQHVLLSTKRALRVGAEM